MCATPRVSIGLPVYNGERYLARALDSILSQNFTDFELIISDNASTDDTANICRQYADRDPRIRYVRHERNRGAAWNYNHVVGLARGEYFKWVAHDDEYRPTFLAQCVAVLDEDPGVVLCHTATVEIDESGRQLSAVTEDFTAPERTPEARFRRLVSYVGGCFHVFGVIRTATLRKTGLIGPFFASDTVLLAELSLHGRFAEVKEPLFRHREHPERSVNKHADARSWIAWFDPNGVGAITLPLWRVALEMLKAVHRGPLDSRQRLRCYLAMRYWVANHWQRLLRNLARAGVDAFKLALGWLRRAPATTAGA